MIESSGKMKDKKGFTLIELLAVIVILAIIALIATPIILNMINDARKNAAKSSALGYIDAVEYNNGFAQLGTSDINGTYEEVKSGDVEAATQKLGSHLKGKAPTSGTVTIDAKGKVTEATLCFNGYNVTYDGADVTKVEKGCNGSNSNVNEQNNEPEINEDYVMSNAGELICTFGSRRFYKAYDGDAYAGYFYNGTYGHPLLVSEDPDAVVFTTSDSGSTKFTYTNTIEYKGKTYYICSDEYAMPYSTSTNGFAKKIGDVIGEVDAAELLLKKAFNEE